MMAVVKSCEILTFLKSSKPYWKTVRQLLTISVIPEMVFESGLNVACSSISAGETNAGIDWYFTVLTLEERKGRDKKKEKKKKDRIKLERDHSSGDNFTMQTKTLHPDDVFKSLHPGHLITPSP